MDASYDAQDIITEYLQLRALQRRRALRRINDAEILASIRNSI